jgi:hypothetical protein
VRQRATHGDRLVIGVSVYRHQEKSSFVVHARIVRGDSVWRAGRLP